MDMARRIVRETIDSALKAGVERVELEAMLVEVASDVRHCHDFLSKG